MSTRVAIIAANSGLFDAYKVCNIATRKRACRRRLYERKCAFYSYLIEMGVE